MREQGTIHRIVADRGFGFIRPAVGQTDLFFHRTALEDQSFEGLRIGDTVTYEVAPGAKGPRAEAVRTA